MPAYPRYDINAAHLERFLEMESDQCHLAGSQENELPREPTLEDLRLTQCNRVKNIYVQLLGVKGDIKDLVSSLCKLAGGNADSVLMLAEKIVLMNDMQFEIASPRV